MRVARGRGWQWRALAARLALAGLVVASAGAGNGLGAAATKPPPPKPAASQPAKPAKKVTTPAQRCTDLESQFDAALPKHSDAKNLNAAQKLRAEGQHLCEEGQHAAGALRLARALVDLGVKPDVN
jgi:hypothetical protein